MRRAHLPRRRGEDIADCFESLPVQDSTVVYQGMIWDVRRDVIDLGHSIVTREYVDHPGAVAIVAMHEIESREHICLIRQYRHAAGGWLWELPAGLLDKPGEDPVAAAARELAEEVDLTASDWHLLTDTFASPGSFPECLRIYLAREIDIAPQPHPRRDEEADIEVAWVPLEEAYAAVLAGQLTNPAAVIGIMAVWGARAAHWSPLRPAGSPWPAHPAYR